MSPLSLVLLALGLLGLALGALLSWVELLAVGFGVALLGVASLLVRAPVAARWWQVGGADPGDAGGCCINPPRGRGHRASQMGAGRFLFERQAWAVPQSGEIAWPIDTSRRGLHAVGPDRLEFADPFGLRRIVLAERESTQVLVVPRVTAVPAPSAPARRWPLRHLGVVMTFAER